MSQLHGDFLTSPVGVSFDHRHKMANTPFYCFEWACSALAHAPRCALEPPPETSFPCPLKPKDRTKTSRPIVEFAHDQAAD